jgi:hypothetical protein
MKAVVRKNVHQDLRIGDKWGKIRVKIRIDSPWHYD